MAKEYSKEQSISTANKLTAIFEKVKELGDTDLEYLDACIDQIQQDQTKQEALGMMFNPNKAEAMIQLGQQAIDRIKGIKLIHHAIIDQFKINVEYWKKEKVSKNFEKQIGL